jgi:multidrug resistance efflux pump
VSERPTPDELAEAIEEFLTGEILPTLDDHRARFRTLVALNALGIVRRELAKLPPEDDAEQRQLAARIRAGDVPAGTLARVKTGVEERLRIASPHYVERYRDASDAGTQRGPADP